MEGVYGKSDEYTHFDQNIMYTVTNIPGKGINIEDFESEFSVGCMCESNCSNNCSCVQNSVNYINKRLNQDKLSKFILECNLFCSCSNNCSNRLVQYGPLPCLEIKKCGDVKGMGCFTNKPIEKYQFLCEYAGEVISVNEALFRIEENKRKNEMNYVLIVSEYIGDRKLTTCIDPKYFGNIGRYCNHSCEPNTFIMPIRIENSIPRICLFASRDINVGEEITFNYAGELETTKNLSDTLCFCNSTNCFKFLPHNPI